MCQLLPFGLDEPAPRSGCEVPTAPVVAFDVVGMAAASHFCFVSRHSQRSWPACARGRKRFLGGRGKDFLQKQSVTCYSLAWHVKASTTTALKGGAALRTVKGLSRAGELAIGVRTPAMLDSSTYPDQTRMSNVQGLEGWSCVRHTAAIELQLCASFKLQDLSFRTHTLTASPFKRFKAQSLPNCAQCAVGICSRQRKEVQVMSGER